ncbi:MAG: hypothetical protein M1486_01730 [Gammaproteobacteria bacterium]|nr:hypothetical protein [Gammaproteobacteria bacterium]
MLFQEAWREFFEARIQDLGQEIMKNPEYIVHFNDTQKQFNSLRESLSAGARERIEKFDASLAAREGVSSDFHYMAGLKDGCALAQWLIIHEAGNDGNDYLEGCLKAHLNLVAGIARVG